MISEGSCDTDDWSNIGLFLKTLSKHHISGILWVK